MSLWEREDVPHRGWTCVETIDLAAALDDVDANRRGDYYETCQMCDKEGIRYVHIMEHPTYSETLRVGCVCAQHMEDDYVNPQSREKELQNKYSRRRNFLRQTWTLNFKSNYFLRYRGQNITIVPGQSGFGVFFRTERTWEFEGKKITTLFRAKCVAFEVFDQYLTERKEQNHMVGYF